MDRCRAVRIAHLSDLHISPVPPPRPWIEAVHLKQVLGYINWLRGRGAHSRIRLAATMAAIAHAEPDAIALSGDIIELGMSSEFAAGATVLSDLSSIAPLALTLGNHDPYTPAAIGRMLTYWGGFLPAAMTTATDPREAYPHVWSSGPLALITLCSGIPTWLFSAEGAIGRAQMQRLETILAALDRTAQVPVLHLHHPPDTARLSPLQRLRDGGQLIHVMARHDCPLILHGHTHRGDIRELSRFGKRLVLAGASSASAVLTTGPAAAGFNLIDVSRRDDCFHIAVSAERFAGGAYNSFDKREWIV